MSLDNKILHKRFKNEDELGEYIAKMLNVDTKVSLVLSDDTDHEDKKFDYEYVGTVVNAGNEIADVYVWVLFDRQKQLYITEFEIESI